MSNTTSENVRYIGFREGIWEFEDRAKRVGPDELGTFSSVVNSWDWDEAEFDYCWGSEYQLAFSAGWDFAYELATEPLAI